MLKDIKPYRQYRFPAALSSEGRDELTRQLWKIVDAVVVFGVPGLAEAYVEFPWKEDFTKVHGAVPTALHSEDEKTGIHGRLDALLMAFERWFEVGRPLLSDDGYPWTGVDDFRTVLWEVLSSLMIKPRHVVGLFSHLLYVGTKTRTRLKDRVKEHEIALRTATAYFNLCTALPLDANEHRDNVYHVMMFNRALDTIKLLSRCVKHDPKASKDSRKRKKRVVLEDGENEADDEDTGGDFCDGLADAPLFVDEDKERIEYECNRCIKALYKCLMWFRGRSKENTEYAADVLLIAARADLTYAVRKTSYDSNLEMTASNAYRTLKVFFNLPRRRSPSDWASWTDDVLLVLKRFVATIHGNFYGHERHSVRELENVRVRASNFLIDSLKDWPQWLRLHPPWLIFLQGLFMRAPDRTEVRRRTAETIVRIMVSGAPEVFLAYLAWVLHAGRSSPKSVHRTMALEIAACLLDAPELLPKVWADTMSLGRFVRAIVAIGFLPTKKEAPSLRAMVDADLALVRRWRAKVVANERVAVNSKIQAIIGPAAEEDDDEDEGDDEETSSAAGASAGRSTRSGVAGMARARAAPAKALRRKKLGLTDEEMQEILNKDEEAGDENASPGGQAAKKKPEQASAKGLEKSKMSVTDDPFLLIFEPDAPSYLAQINSAAPTQVAVIEAMLYKRIFLFVMSRLQDVTPTVQIRALQMLTKCLHTPTTKLIGVVSAILEDKEEDFEEVYVEPDDDQDGQDSDRLDTSDDAELSDSPSRKRSHDGRLKSSGQLRRVRRRRQPEHQEGDHFVPMESMGGREVVEALLDLSADSSANMRRASLTTLLQIYQIVPTMLSEERGPSIIAWRCYDESMMVRKEMIQGLDLLLNYLPNDDVVKKCWLHGIMGRVKDPEAAVQRKALEILRKTFIEDVIDGDYESLADSAPVGLLRLADMTCQVHHLEFAFSQWKENKELAYEHLCKLIKLTSPEHAEGAEGEIALLCSMWVQEVGCPSRMVPMLGEFAMRVISEPWKHQLLAPLKCMELVTAISDKMDKEMREAFDKVIWKGLRSYQYPPDLISKGLEAWLEIQGDQPDETPDKTPGKTPGNTPDKTPGNTPDKTPGKTPDKTPDKAPDKRMMMRTKGCLAHLMMRADQALLGIFAGSNYLAFLKAEGEQGGEEEGLLGQEQEDSNMHIEDPSAFYRLHEGEEDDGLEPFIPSPNSQGPSESDDAQQVEKAGISKLLLPSDEKIIRMIFTVAHCCSIYPPLMKMADVRTPTVLRVALYGSVDVLSHKPSKDILHASLAALGMLSVANVKLAHRCFRSISTYVGAKSWKVRYISACIVASIIVKYQELNTKNLSELYPLLFDTNLQVRRMSVVIIVDLLQESRLKINSEHLIYLLLRCLVDEDDEISATASFYLSSSMKKAAPKLFSQRMLGAIYFFNGLLDKQAAGGKVGGDPLMDVSAVAASSAGPSASDDYIDFEFVDAKLGEHAMPGRDEQEKRLQIYSFMLQHIDDQARLTVAEIIAKEILAKFGINAVDVTPQNEDVLSDALRILAIQEAKEHCRGDKTDEMLADVDVLDQTTVRVAVDLAKKKAEHLKQWDTLMLDTILPDVVKTYEFAKKADSYVAEDIEIFCVEIFRDFREKATKVILEKDLDLAKEVQALSREGRRFPLPPERPFNPERILHTEGAPTAVDENVFDSSDLPRRYQDRHMQRMMEVLGVSDDEVDDDDDDEDNDDDDDGEEAVPETMPEVQYDGKDPWAEVAPARNPERSANLEEDLDDVLRMVSRMNAQEEEVCVLQDPDLSACVRRNEFLNGISKVWHYVPVSMSQGTQKSSARKPQREPGSRSVDDLEMELTHGSPLTPSTPGGFSGGEQTNSPGSVDELSPQSGYGTRGAGAGPVSPISLSSSSDGQLPEELPPPTPITFEEAHRNYEQNYPNFTLPEEPLSSPTVDALSEEEPFQDDVPYVAPTFGSPRAYDEYPPEDEPVVVDWGADEQLDFLDQPLLAYGDSSLINENQAIGQEQPEPEEGEGIFDINAIGGVNPLPPMSMEEVETGEGFEYYEDVY